MRFGADNYRNRGRTEKSVSFRIPAGLFEDAMSRGRERAKIRDGGAGDERATAFKRKPKNVEQPAQRDFLEQRCCWSGTPKTGVLVPGSREPVARNRNGERAADDEAEKARARHCRRPRRTDLIQES